jgi:hypothetical protein
MRKSLVCTWRAWPVLLAVAVAGIPAVAADRIVVCEEFGRVTCSYCPTAGAALDLMLQNFPNTFISVAVQTAVYPCAWGNERTSFYAISGVPTAEFDGMIECRGAYSTVAQQYSWYLSAYNSCMTVPTDVVVGLQCFKVAADRIRVKAEIGIESTGVGKSMRVHFVQLLDHWPFGYTWTRDGVKQGQNMGVISLTPGQSTVLTYDFTLDADSLAHPNDVKVVVFAQDTLASKPAQVYNGNFLNGPFGFRKGDLNCDGNVDFGDINPFVLALTNPAGYAVQFPACDIMNGDINGDNVVDFGDINPFVRLLTNP